MRMAAQQQVPLPGGLGNRQTRESGLDELGGGERDKRFQESLKKPRSQNREVLLRINLRRRARGI